MYAPIAASSLRSLKSSGGSKNYAGSIGHNLDFYVACRIAEGDDDVRVNRKHCDSMGDVSRDVSMVLLEPARVCR